MIGYFLQNYSLDNYFLTDYWVEYGTFIPQIIFPEVYINLGAKELSFINGNLIVEINTGQSTGA